MKQNDLKLLLFIKSGEIKADGTCPIMGRITIGKSVAQFATKQPVPECLWDTGANRASGKSWKAVEVNRTLDSISVSIKKRYLDKPSWILTRDMFVFSVFTGLAYVDICNLTDAHIVKTDDGMYWIKTSRQKTGSHCEIPLLPVAQQVLDKYKGMSENGKLLPVPTCWHLDKQLKQVAKACGINKSIGMHTARHSFATTICLSNGVQLESVSRMLGHRNLLTTQNYARTTVDKIAVDMEQIESRVEEEFAFNAIAV